MLNELNFVMNYVFTLETWYSFFVRGRQPATISILSTTDLPAAWQIEQRAHAFPWSEKTFFGNQGERYLNLK
ncbi:hypothetical protein MJN51_30835, partial [Salmonella enterica subsp. enterica serovar Kentucky]|nr:hypothetical protein [Salmonella enterica subsp. enterica serovar Kentucky]